MWKDERAKKMPDGFYFDPEDRLGGKWSEATAAEMKVLAEKCGCNAAAAKKVGASLVAILALAATLLCF